MKLAEFSLQKDLFNTQISKNDLALKYVNGNAMKINL